MRSASDSGDDRANFKIEKKKKETTFFLLIERLQKNCAGTEKVASKQKEV